MIKAVEQKKCTGCQTCRLVCPEKCIRMVRDSEGFAAPCTDLSQCTNCGLCESVCPAYNNTELYRNACIKVMGASNKNNTLLMRSASGGVFAGIASKILETPGNAVIGCAFDEEITARQTCITDIKGLPMLQSSKYVQSDTEDTYLQTNALLDKGKTVFYSGTPCQVAGLYAFLNKDPDNLLTADLICHGVPSPLLFKRYLQWLGNKHVGKVVSYNFRSKEKDGWGLTAKIIIDAKNGKKNRFIDPYIDPYYNSYLGSLTLRECCYSCPYTNKYRIGDITLGDFWGVHKQYPEIYNTGGVSAVLVNTKKGERFLNMVLEELYIFNATYEKAAANNLCLSQPSPRTVLRDKAYDGINNENTNIFNSPIYKVSKSKIWISHIKAGVKSIIPATIIKQYRKIKQRAY